MTCTQRSNRERDYSTTIAQKMLFQYFLMSILGIFRLPFKIKNQQTLVRQFSYAQKLTRVGEWYEFH